MAYCPAVFTLIGDDVQLQESWTTWLSRWTPEELEWIRKMLEAHPDTTEKVLLVTAGSLSTWLGPMFLKWSRDFLVSVILLTNHFPFLSIMLLFIFQKDLWRGQPVQTDQLLRRIEEAFEKRRDLLQELRDLPSSESSSKSFLVAPYIVPYLI